MKIRHLLSVIMIQLMIGVSVASGSIIAVDFGADYTAANINASKTLGVDATVDADFDGVADDRAGSIAFGTVFTPAGSASWTTPVGKSGPVIKFGVSLANIDSIVDPDNLAMSRIAAYDAIEASNNPGTAAMRMASAWYWEQSSFLNGLNSASGLTFANEAASLSATFNNTGTPTAGNEREGRFLVQSDGQWYVSQSRFAGTGGLLSINAATAEWYVFDPAAGTLFWDLNDVGSSVLGSTLTDITAIGVYVQHELFDGTTGSSAKEGFSTLQANLVPEPATIGLFGMGVLGVLFVRRVRR